MAITRLNNNSISAVSALPSGIDTGKIGQVLSANSTSYSTTSTSYTDIISLAITPSATSSKVLVTAFLKDKISGSSTTNAGAAVKLLAGSTSVIEMNTFKYGQVGGANVDDFLDGSFHQHLITTNTASEVIIKYQAKRTQGTSYAVDQSTITLMEILA